jgi:hypothetical protein
LASEEIPLFPDTNVRSLECSLYPLSSRGEAPSLARKAAEALGLPVVDVVTEAPEWLDVRIAIHDFNVCLVVRPTAQLEGADEIQTTAASFVASISFRTPLSSKPPSWPYAVSLPCSSQNRDYLISYILQTRQAVIPCPNCLRSNLRLQHPSRQALPANASGWDIFIRPHVPVSTNPAASATEGSFQSTSSLLLRWAPILPDDPPALSLGHVESTLLLTPSHELYFNANISGISYPGAVDRVGLTVLIPRLESLQVLEVEGDGVLGWSLLPSQKPQIRLPPTPPDEEAVSSPSLRPPRQKTISGSEVDLRRTPAPFLKNRDSESDLGLGIVLDAASFTPSGSVDMRYDDDDGNDVSSGISVSLDLTQLSGGKAKMTLAVGVRPLTMRLLPLVHVSEAKQHMCTLVTEGSVDFDPPRLAERTEAGWRMDVKPNSEPARLLKVRSRSPSPNPPATATNTAFLHYRIQSPPVLQKVEFSVFSAQRRQHVRMNTDLAGILPAGTGPSPSHFRLTGIPTADDVVAFLGAHRVAVTSPPAVDDTFDIEIPAHNYSSSSSFQHSLPLQVSYSFRQSNNERIRLPAFPCRISFVDMSFSSPGACAFCCS